MPVRVELIDEAIDDLAGYQETDVFPHLLAKLIRLEEVGEAAGLPLGKGLTGWRKIVVGDRNWRIIFTTNEKRTVATVWVIGDRDDAACYETARRRLNTLPETHPQAASLAAAMYQLAQRRLAAKRRSKGKKR